MLRAALVRRDKGQVDVGLHHRGELHLRLLRRFLQALQRHPVLAEVDTVALLELRGDPLDHTLIEVVTSQMCVAVGGLDLHDTFTNFEDGDVERAATEVVDGDGLVLLLVEAVGKGCRRRFVHDAHDLEPGNLARFLGCLALRVVEVRGDGDHRLDHRLSQVLLGSLLQLLQNHPGDFRWRVLLATSLYSNIAVRRSDHAVGHHLLFLGDLGVAPSHEALDRENRVLGIGYRLALRHLADEPFARLGKGHHRRREATAFRIGDHYGLTALHHGHNGVRGAQVDTDDFAHVSRVLFAAGFSFDLLLNLSDLMSISAVVLRLQRPDKRLNHNISAYTVHTGR